MLQEFFQSDGLLHFKDVSSWTLDLSENDLDDQTLESLRIVLQGASVESLDLDQNRITTDGALALVGVTNIKHVSMKYNPIDCPDLVLQAAGHPDKIDVGPNWNCENGSRAVTDRL